MKIIQQKINELKSREEFLLKCLDANSQNTVNIDENKKGIDEEIKSKLKEIENKIADFNNDLKKLKEIEEKKNKQTIILKEDITVHSSNIRTIKGNRARKDKKLKAGEYKLVDEFVSTSPVYHGNKVFKLTDGKYTYAILDSEKIG